MFQKTIVLAALAGAGYGAAIRGTAKSQHEPRQMQLPSPQPLLPMVASFAKPYTRSPVSVEDAEPQLSDQSLRKIYRWGPFELGTPTTERSGSHLDPHGDSYNELIDGLCRDCMILSAASYLTYENGSRADVATGVYSHHIFVGDVSFEKNNRQGVQCAMPTNMSATLGGASAWTPSAGGGMGGMGGMEGMEGMEGTGDFLKGLQDLLPEGLDLGELRSMAGGLSGTSMPVSQMFGSGDDGHAITYASMDPDGDLKAGYYVGKNDLAFHFSEFVNYRDYPQKVYFTADVEYVEGWPEGWRDAQLGSVSALGCGGVGYNPPTDRATTQVSPPYTVTVPGTIYNVYAHLHDGGVNVKMSINGELVCDSKAEYGGEHGTTEIDGEKWETIQAYTECTDEVEVKKGDKMVVEATYDPTAHRLRPGAGDHSMGAEAMGMLGYSFSPKPE